jgi:hypothetical protein
MGGMLFLSVWEDNLAYVGICLPSIGFRTAMGDLVVDWDNVRLPLLLVGPSKAK